MRNQKPVFNSLYKPSYFLGIPTPLIILLSVVCIALGLFFHLILYWILILIISVAFLGVVFIRDRDFLIAEKTILHCPSISKKEKEETFFPDTSMTDKQEKIFQYMEKQIPYSYLLDLSPEIVGNEFPIDERYQKAFCQTKDNSIIVSYVVDPKDSQMLDDELERRSEMLAKMLSESIDKHYEFYFDFKRRYCPYKYEDMTQYMEEGSAKEIEKIRAKHFSNSGSFFRNTCTMTILYRPQGDKGVSLKNLLTMDMVLSHLEVLKRIESYFRSSNIDLHVLSHDELVQYLYETVTDDPNTICAVPSGDWKKTENGKEGTNQLVNYETISTTITNCISDIRLNCDPLEMNGRLIDILELPELPRDTVPDMFWTMRFIPFPCRVMLRYKASAKNEFLDAVEKKFQKQKSGKYKTGGIIKSAFSEDKTIQDDQISITEEQNELESKSALEYVHDHDYSGGYFSGAVIISTPSQEAKRLKSIKNEIESTLLSAGLPFKGCTAHNILSTYFTAIPGYNGTAYHSMQCHAGNVADCIPISSFAENKVSRNLKLITNSEVPHLYGRHADGSVFWFSCSGPFGEQGMTFLTGAPGTGKSILLALMAAQWLKFKDSQVIFFDIGLSSLNIVQSNKGKVFYPGVDNTTFCPFKDAKNHREAIEKFIEQICNTNGKEFSAKMKTAVSETIKHMSHKDETFAAFYSIIAGLDNDGLAEILYPYIDNYAHIFNSTDDSFLNLPRISTIELSNLLNDGVESLYIPALTYMFHRIEQYFDGVHPVFLVLDEAWKYLQIEYFAKYILSWIKGLRKKHVYVVLATQELNDLMNGGAAAQAIVNDCETNIFLPNARATDPYIGKFYEGIGLLQHEIELISKMPQFTYLVRHNTQKQIAHIDFMVDEPQLKYLRTTPDMVLSYKDRMEKLSNKAS